MKDVNEACVGGSCESNRDFLSDCVSDSTFFFEGNAGCWLHLTRHESWVMTHDVERGFRTCSINPLNVKCINSFIPESSSVSSIFIPSIDPLSKPSITFALIENCLRQQRHTPYRITSDKLSGCLDVSLHIFIYTDMKCTQSHAKKRRRKTNGLIVSTQKVTHTTLVQDSRRMHLSISFHLYFQPPSFVAWQETLARKLPSCSFPSAWRQRREERKDRR